MKIKDLEGTVNVAWSPSQQNPILLAAGTAAQQLDASFSTNASIQLYSLNLNEPGFETKLLSTAPSDQRFHNVKWGSYGMNNDQANGIIVGGCDGGLLQIYSAAKLLNGESGLISKQTKHSGPVHALDFNNFQNNLLATGSSESEIYIWDLNNTSTPMTPGAKSQPPEDVLCIAWNCQVQHILCSTSSTRCVVWDLRKNEPVIKLTDTGSRIRWKDVAWHPDVGTQLCLASEEDQAPIIQLWDLRFATSPLKVLENHQRGVLSITWCKQDPDLLVSCGKDNRILCWNPNSDKPGGEVLSEIARTSQWNFDVNWCPRNPALIAASSFDGHVSVYSLSGGTTQQVQTSNKIADSFPGMEGYAQAPLPQQTVAPVSVDLSKPPKWLKRPVGASFGFGGKLVTFENSSASAANAAALQDHFQNAQAQKVPRQVVINQVVTEPSLVEQSTQLEQALEYGNFTEYCRNKADSMSDQHKRYIWHFLRANFEEDCRNELLNLLGYNADEINAKLFEHIKKNGTAEGNEVDGLSNQMASLNSRNAYEDNTDLASNGGSDYSPEEYNNIGAFDSNAIKNYGANTEWKKTSIKPYQIKTGDDSDGMICQALLMGNVKAAVELCLEAGRTADAIIVAMTGGSELLARTQFRYLQQSEGYVSSLISAVVSDDWTSIVDECSLDSWKEALVAVINYSSDQELPKLCERLGVRLENESNGTGKLFQDAQLCYICAGSFDKLVSSWSSAIALGPDEMQELVELVTFLQKAVERQGRMVEISGNLAQLMSQYASLLASQGHTKTALNYLGSQTQDPRVIELKERLFCNLGQKPAYPGQSTRQHSRLSSTRQSFNQSYPNYGTQQQQQQAPSYPQFNTGLPSSTMPPPAQPWAQPQQQQQPPMPPAPLTPSMQPPPLQPPPRPTSVGSTSGGGGGIHGRVKHLVDPSVQSGGYGAMGGRSYYGAGAGMAPPNPSPYMQQNQTVTQQPPMFQTNALANSANQFMTPAPAVAPTMPPTSILQPTQPMVPGFQTPVGMPASSASNISALNPSGTFPPLPPTAGGPSSFNLNPVSSAMPGTIMTPAEVSRPAAAPLQPPPTQGFAQSTPGWNDPPMIQKSSRPPPPKPEMAAHAPITHPLFGSAAPEQPAASVPPFMNNGYGADPSAMMNSFGGQMQQQQPMQQVPQHQRFQTTLPSYQHQQQQQHQNNMGGGAQEIMGREEKPQVIQKAPIPEEHIHMQTVFDTLRHECSCAAHNPQTKRKLDDVARKLEYLYDLLREKSLAPNTLASLHQIVQLIQNGDYTGGLTLHTQMVSGSDFSQIASFMPGLKVLLQCALQLNVYLR